jgi:HEAT repeat protein
LDGLLTVLQGSNPLARVYAAERMVDFGDEAVPALLTAQKQCGRCIRFLAIETLGHIGSDEALTGLIDLLGDGNVAYALEAVLLSHSKRCAPAIAEALKQTKLKDKRRRQACAKLLWRLNAKEHLEPYLGDAEPIIKAYAQAAIWSRERLESRTKQRGVTGLPAAVTLFEQGTLDLSDLTRNLDRMAKNRLTNVAAVLQHTAAEGPVLTHYLPQITAGRRKKIREQAAALVTRLANPAVLFSLLRLLDSHQDMALRALAEVGDSTAVWPLLQLAQRQEPYQRDAVITALGRIGDPVATPALLQMLNEALSRAGRKVIEKALVAIGSPAVEPVSRALLALESSQVGTAPPLERVLGKLKTPKAQAALETYWANTDDLTRLLNHLTDGKVTVDVIKQTAALGIEALEPLLNLVIKGRVEGQRNAIRVLGEMADQFSDDQRDGVIDALRNYLQARHPQRRFWGYGWTADPVVEDIVTFLCDLNAETAAAEITDALVVAGVGKSLLKQWKKTSSTWLIDVIAHGIQKPDTRYQALHVAQEMYVDEAIIPQLWTAVKAVLQSETDAYKLQIAVNCLRTWGDSKGVDLLKQLRQRWGTVSGHTWIKNRLDKDVNDTLAELQAKDSFFKRLTKG